MFCDWIQMCLDVVVFFPLYLLTQTNNYHIYSSSEVNVSIQCRDRLGQSQAEDSGAVAASFPSGWGRLLVLYVHQ